VVFYRGAEEREEADREMVGETFTGDSWREMPEGGKRARRKRRKQRI